MGPSPGYDTTQSNQDQQHQPMWLDLNGIISPAHCSTLGPENPKAQPAVTQRITGGKEGREVRGGSGKQTHVNR